MKKKIFLIISAVCLIILSAGMIFWYFKGAREAERALRTAEEKARQQVPKEVTIKIYFGNSQMNPNVSNCKTVFPVERIVENDLIVRRRAIEELLKGPTAVEKEQGYFSSIPSREEIIAYREKVRQESGQAPYEGEEIKIKSFKILAGSAYIDFSGEMRAYGGGSCRVEAIKAQINETIKQFPKVGHAVISIEGDKDALQP